jgi:hypothetical protein
MIIRFVNYISFNQKLNIFLKDDIKTIPIQQSWIYSLSIEYLFILGIIEKNGWLK